MRTVTNTLLALSLTLGSVAVLGCDDDRTVQSSEKTRTSSDGSTETKKTETKVDNDTGAVKHETTVEKKDTTP